MIKPLQFFRLIKINAIIMRHSFTRTVIGKQSTTLRLLSYFNPWSFARQHHSRGEALRITLEKLGPIFVKFGQVLSIRQDLLPPDIIAELSKLQDNVSPFPGKKAKKIIESSLKKSIDACFASFETEPLASASIAQVHAGRLHDGSDVIVKVLRPNILRTIQQDVALMYLVARLTRRFWRHGKRLRPVEIVAEFEQVILDELDLAREAANASQLRRNFENSTMMYVPKIVWPFVTRDVMVMERIYGIRISDVDTLKAHHVDLKKLAEYGVEIFFTQVLRDSFFHADMHPGNLFVDIKDPQKPFYLGVDFGIMGSLSEEDQHYLAENLVAFFNRDYRRVAVLHVESGWVPPDTRVEQFEAAIRTVSEPIFERPLKDISFGQLLFNLFQVAKRFHMEVQPQLMLLQKTLLSIEGLGRQLYPDLDLWVTAKPILEKWVRKRHSVKDVLKNTVREIPGMLEKSLETPEVLFGVLSEWRRLQQASRYDHSQDVRYVEKKSEKVKGFFFGLGVTFAAASAVIYLITHKPADLSTMWVWLTGIAAGITLLIGWSR